MSSPDRRLIDEIGTQPRAADDRLDPRSGLFLHACNLKYDPSNLQPLTFNQEVLGSSSSALTKKQHQYKGLQPASGAVAQGRHLCSPHGRFGTPPERLRPRAGCQAPASRKNPPPGLLGDLGDVG